MRPSDGQTRSLSISTIKVPPHSAPSPSSHCSLAFSESGTALNLDHRRLLEPAGAQTEPLGGQPAPGNGLESMSDTKLTHSSANSSQVEEKMAAGPVSRIRRAAMKTDNLFKIRLRGVSTMSTVSVLAGFASHRRHNERSETIVC
jgi:hypothetical protein